MKLRRLRAALEHHQLRKIMEAASRSHHAPVCQQGVTACPVAAKKTKKGQKLRRAATEHQKAAEDTDAVAHGVREERFHQPASTDTMSI